MLRALKTLVVLLGGSLIAAALALILVLSFAVDRRPPPADTPQEERAQRRAAVVGGEDLAFAGAIAGVAGGAILLLGVAGWVKCGREPWFRDDVDALWANPWVRVLGIPPTCGVLGGALYLVMEHATATAEYPARHDDLLPFMGGCAVLGLVVYLPLWAVARLLRRRD